jgi:hypothetical protein
MDFFLPICRRHDSISYETPRFDDDDILYRPLPSGHPFSSYVILFREAFRHCILFRMVGYALTVNTISLEKLLAAVAAHVTALEGSHVRVEYSR